MSSWNDIFSEVTGPGQHRSIDDVRRDCIKDLSNMTGRNVICYYSGWLQKNNFGGLDLSINDNDMNGLMNAIYGMDKTRGLDLILHTPGGSFSATEAIVSYLRSCFPTEIRAIVPHLSMSCGTMIACACNEILMGRESSLGPTDPQFNGIPAGGVIAEFKKAKEDVRNDPSSVALWAQIIGKYPPTFLGNCQMAYEKSRETIKRWLIQWMFANDSEASGKAETISQFLNDHSQSGMHDRHYSYDDLVAKGLNVKRLEDSNDLQDKVLSIHHAFMCSFQLSQACKIIESSTGRTWIVQAPHPQTS